MSGHDDVLNDPLFKEWAQHTRTHLVPMMQDSTLVVTLVPKGDADMKFAVELGLSIMLDKPVILVVEPGQIIAGKLRAVADEIVEWSRGDGPAALTEKIEAVTKRFPPPEGASDE